MREKIIYPLGLTIDADKRAHHNAMERKSPEHIKENLPMPNLRDSAPAFQDDKVDKTHNASERKKPDHMKSSSSISNLKDILPAFQGDKVKKSSIKLNLSRVYQKKSLKWKRADKRAHCNVLEKNRRDDIKLIFSKLKESLPALQDEKVKATQAQILKKAAVHIQTMHKTICNQQQKIDDLKKANEATQAQILIFEAIKSMLEMVSCKQDMDDSKNQNKLLEATQAQILKFEAIKSMLEKVSCQQDMDDLKKQNKLLE